MTNLFRCVFILALLFSYRVGYCGDYGSWWQKTKYGNEICNEKGVNGYIIGIKCQDHKQVAENGHTITNLNRWYLYRNHIIGEIVDKGQKIFFVFNEVSCQSQVFQNEEEFNARVSEIDLKPIIWTRWYTENWGFFITDGDLADKLNFTWVKVPALFIIGLVTLIGLLRTRFNLKHKFNKATLVIIGLIILRILLDLFPDSI